MVITINQTIYYLKGRMSSEEMSKEIILKKLKTICLGLLWIFFNEYFAIKFLKN